MFIQVLIDNIKEFAPIIYTPTVGLVCQNYCGLFRRPRGMYFSAKDKGEMMSMIYNWPAEQVWPDFLKVKWPPCLLFYSCLRCMFKLYTYPEHILCIVAQYHIATLCSILISYICFGNYGSWCFFCYFSHSTYLPFVR